jgi:uncharacterized membrane protein
MNQNQWRTVLFLLLLLSSSAFVSADELAIAQTVEAGQEAEYHVEVHNETSESHDYSLSVEGLAADFQASFTQGAAVLETISVDAKSFAPIILRLATALETPIGDYRAEIVLNRDDGLRLTIPLRLRVENTYAVRISSQTLNITSFSGQEFSFEVSALNSGAGDLHNLRLVVEVLPKWLLETSPSVVESLAPNETATFEVRVLIPPSQVAAELPLKFHLEAEEVSSPDASLLVRVQSNPDYLVYALGLGIVAIVAVVIYFRLKGRR